jgi:hypothetical protein
MRDVKGRQGRMVWFFLLLGAACLASGAARAACPVSGTVSSTSCYILVQAIDVCSSSGTNCAPFNTISSTGNPATQSQTGNNPIGFFDPNGKDVTRALLNQMGIDLVYNTRPTNLSGGANIVQYNSPNNPTTNPTTTFQTLNVTQGATCVGSIPKGATTLTIASCSSGLPTVGDTLSDAGGNIPSGTSITALGTVMPGGAGTYTVSAAPSNSKVVSITITFTSTKFQSQDFLTLSYQPQINQGASIPPLPTSPSTCGQGGSIFPCAPLGNPSTVYNLFFVNTLNPPTSQTGGQLNGFTYKGNNGTAIGANAFSPPAGVPLPIDVFAHEFLHGLGLDHGTFAAGPWTAPTGQNSSYVAPSGILTPVLTMNPLAGECDPSYPACKANLMTVGTLRTEPTLQCVLAPSLSLGTPPAACLSTVGGTTTQSPGLYAGTADQLTLESQETTANPITLPMSQQKQVLTSTLLHNPTQSGFLHPIPRETTKAQAATDDGSTDRVTFDLSRPVGGTPGETLVAWVLTLAQGQTFAGSGQFDILAQSRKDLVQSIDYYPAAEHYRHIRNIAYRPGAENHFGNPSIGAADPSPCASAGAECLMVNFQPPGLGTRDTIKFSETILSGGAPITNDDLCKAKITYIFSDGYATTGDFSPCPAKSSALIASSWVPDLTVPPRIVKSNVLLAQASDQNGTVNGAAYFVPEAEAKNAVIGFAHGTANATFTVPSPTNSACSTGMFPGDTLCFDSRVSAPLGGFPNAYTLGGFLASGGATNVTGSANDLGQALDNGTTGMIFEFTGMVTVTNGQQFTVAHDDGLSLTIGGIPVITVPGPTSPNNTVATYTGPAGTFQFDLVYGECCGAPAVLATSLPLQSQLACNVDPQNPGQCQFQQQVTGLSDGSIFEVLQPGQSCGGTGAINHDVTVNANQNCVFQACSIQGNFINNGGQVYLDCAVQGAVTQNGGSLVLGGNANVQGKQVSISGASSFRVEPGAFIQGTLVINGVTSQPQPGTVCGTNVQGSVQVTNNLSPIQIGETTGQTNCPGNTIGTNLVCSGNTPSATSGSNTVKGKNQCPLNN